MPTHSTTTGQDNNLLSILASILELAVSQDGTHDAAQTALFEIEDRAAAAIHRQ
jgi:hypothetical protein